MVTTPSPGTAPNALLEAHVAFELQRWQGPGFASEAAVEIAEALRAGEHIRLADAVTRESVRQVANKYVATFDLPGAIPEVAAEIAARAKASEIQGLDLGEIVERHHVVKFARVISQMRPVREGLARNLATNPGVQAGVAGVAHRAVNDVFGSLRRNAERMPGAASAFSLGDRVAGEAIGEADRLSKEAMESAAGVLLGYVSGRAMPTMTDHDVEQALLEAWDALAHRSVGELLGSISDENLIDLFIAAYELWLGVRTGPYIGSLVDLGVDYFFDAYGAHSLTELLTEFGLGEEDLHVEAMRFGPRAIAALAQSGALEALIRRRLEPFYLSPEFQAASRVAPS